MSNSKDKDCAVGNVLSLDCLRDGSSYLADRLFETVG